MTIESIENIIKLAINVTRKRRDVQVGIQMMETAKYS